MVGKLNYVLTNTKHKLELLLVLCMTTRKLMIVKRLNFIKSSTVVSILSLCPSAQESISLAISQMSTLTKVSL